MLEKFQTDKSWGMIGAARVSCSGREHFQSDVKNTNYITLTIKQAKKSRELKRDWVMGDEIICQVSLTPLQWADMLTNMNVGDGVPCTIEFTQRDGSVPYKPEPKRLDTILCERSEEIDSAVSAVQEVQQKIKDLVSGRRLSKTIGDELLHKLAQSVSIFESNGSAFAKTRATEEIASMVVQAKAAVGAYIDDKIYQTGLTELARQKGLLLTDSSNSDDDFEPIASMVLGDGRYD